MLVEHKMVVQNMPEPPEVNTVLGNLVHKMVRMMLVLVENMQGVHSCLHLSICHQLEAEKRKVLNCINFLK